MKKTPNTRIIDGHVHLYRLADIKGFEQVKKATGIDSLGIACIASREPRLNLLGLLYKVLHPAQTYVFGGLDYSMPGAKAGGGDFAGQARRLMKLGADGMKMLEGKPNTRRDIGIPLDSPLYDEYFQFLQANAIPILFHVADPEEFWDEKKAPKFAKENNWLWTDPSFPPKEQLYKETESVLRKFPKLKIIFAHFYFLSADLNRASAFLDRWPNVCFDITPGTEMYYNFSKKPQAWRDFFIKYQDRIVFGTDNVTSYEGAVDWSIKNISRIRQFLETVSAFSGPGLNLDKAVTDNIYAKNFERVVGKKPKKVNLKALQTATAQMLEKSEAEAKKAADSMRETKAILNALKAKYVR